jgi:hypothetical protein
MDEAKACVRKYLSAASVENWLNLSDIKGINERRLISSPIQAPNQEDEEMAIKDPATSVK